ncbi:MAG: orotidine-5'-phosphate decarboxylase [Candidatus Latescibacterota bacterium]
MGFLEKLKTASRTRQSLLCVGLDTDADRIPGHLNGDVLAFNRAIIEATSDLVCAYKPNIAFYEAMGEHGWRTLRDTIRAVPEDIPVILDAKRGDIGNTAQRYAQAFFRELEVDAVTVNAYMGFDAVAPFLAFKDRCTFILCLTSNAGSADFQRLSCEGKPLYHWMAEKTVAWSERGPCGLVVGATHPEELREIRELAPQLPFLIPGLGAQGGDVETSVRFGTDANGEGAILNSSRGILYASNGSNFAEDARKAAERLRAEIQRSRKGA